LILAFFPSQLFAQQPLEGCVAAEKIRTLLARLNKDDWQGMSLDRIRSMWPVELADIEFDSDNSGFVTSQDRIIAGNCQCCVVFEFNVQKESNQPRNEQLRGIIVNYSATQRAALILIARTLASASGAKPADVKTIDAKARQGFQWEAIKGNHRNLNVLEMQLSRERNLWKLHFTLGRHAVK
jgi:hypothetical protein